MYIRNIAVETRFGVVIRQETDIGEFPAEDIDEENDGFGFGTVGWGGDVGVYFVDFGRGAAGGAVVDGAGETAGI